MQYFSKLSTVALAIMVGLIFGAAINKQATMTAEAQVFTTCQTSRMSRTVSEKACGELQDKYGIEYLCEQANTSPTNYCWTEAK